METSAAKNQQADTQESLESRERLQAFRQRLEDTKVPAFNPIVEFRTLLRLSVNEMAGVAYYSAGRFYAIEAGLIATVPRSVLNLAEEFLGPGAASVFETAWQRWRGTLPDEIKKKLREKYFPAGEVYGWGTE